MAAEQEHKRQRQPTEYNDWAPDKTLFILVGEDATVELVLLQTDEDTGRKFRQAFQETKKNDISKHVTMTCIFDRRESDRGKKSVDFFPESPFVWGVRYVDLLVKDNFPDNGEPEDPCPLLEWIPDLAKKTWTLTYLNDDFSDLVRPILCQTFC